MEDIIKNLGDTRDYKIVQLPNNIKCLMISDKNVDVSSFCLNVSVGALEDPLEFQGLAHVLEHFLFTASEKYPNLDDFSNFLLANLGSINSGTDLDCATYFFDCNSSMFEQGLERFMTYVTNPKFDNSHLEKTLQVVPLTYIFIKLCPKIISSEFDINKNNDYYKNFQILRNTSDKKSPFNKFGMGSKNTLKPGKSILDSVINFYETYYSSNLMTVVIYAKEDLNSLESIIKQHLSSLPSQNITKPTYPLAPFNQSNMKKFFKVVSTNEVDELNFIWVVDFIKDTHFSKPLNYIWYIMNFGGPNSLFSFLRQREYVLDLNVKFSNYFENFSLFEIRLKLTPFGFQKTQEIVNIIFDYIDFIISNGISKEIFDEAQKLSFLNFHYTQKKIDFPYMSTLAKKLGNTPDKYLLIEEHLWEKYDEELIRNTLKSLKLDNLFVFLNSKKIEKTDKFDHFYNTNYSSETIPEVFLQKGQFIKEFSLISLNPFVPKSTKNISNPNLKEFTKIPKKIYSSEQSDIFYRYDGKFKIPFCFARVRVFLGEMGMHKNEKFNLYWQIWKDLIVEHLSETVAQILRAHGKFAFVLEENSILLSFRGFSDTIALMIQKIVDEINKCAFEKKFERVKKILEGINFENEKFFDSDPWVISDHYLRILLLNQGDFHKKELIEEGRKLDYNSFLEFTKSLLPLSKKSWLIYGNIEEVTAVDIAQYFEKNFLKAEKVSSQLKEKNDEICCLKLKEKTSIVFEDIIEKEISKNVNYSCLNAYWQIGEDTPKNRLLSYIITFLISDPIYNSLSLSGKLGYSENGYELLRGVLGYKVKILSKNSCSQYLIQRVEEALTTIKDIVYNIDEKKFEDLKNIVLFGITSESVEFDEEFENDWVQMSRNELDFKRDQLEKEALKVITRKDIEEFFEETFLKNPRKIEIHVSNKYFQDQNIFQYEQRLKEAQEIKFIRDTSIEELKKGFATFPSFY